jgi:hypothetical protein
MRSMTDEGAAVRSDLAALRHTLVRPAKARRSRPARLSTGAHSAPFAGTFSRKREKGARPTRRFIVHPH